MLGGVEGGFDMKRFREGANRQQLLLLPASVEEYVPPGDLVRYVDALVDEFELSGIESCYSTLGRPAYAPRMLVKLLIYGKLRGVRSSRELSRATQENLRFIFLCCNERPDFRTISDFRKRFHEELGGLLAQTIQIGLQEKLIDLEDVLIDGTLLGGYAARKTFIKSAKLEERLFELEKELAESFKRDMEQDAEKETRSQDDDEGTGLPKELRDKQRLKRKLQAALTHYKQIKGEKPKFVSISDPECRFMKKNGIRPSYNAQLAVDAKSRMAVAGYATNAVGDAGELIKVIEEVCQNTAKNPKRICADKGYVQHIGFHEMKRRNIEGYIPQREGFVEVVTEPDLSIKGFSYSPQRDTISCPQNEVLQLSHFSPDRRGRKISLYDSEACSSCLERTKCRYQNAIFQEKISKQIHRWLAFRMKETAESEAGRLMKILRCSTVETTFGHLKTAKKLQRYCFQGVKMINSMWKLELTAYNLERLIKLRLNYQAIAA